MTRVLFVFTSVDTDLKGKPTVSELTCLIPLRHISSLNHSRVGTCLKLPILIMVCSMCPETVQSYEWRQSYKMTWTSISHLQRAPIRL